MNVTLAEYANAMGASISVNGFSCPKCPVDYELNEPIDSTGPTFEVGENVGPHYVWYETHKCKNCGGLYAIENGD